MYFPQQGMHLDRESVGRQKEKERKEKQKKKKEEGEEKEKGGESRERRLRIVPCGAVNPPTSSRVRCGCLWPTSF